MAKSKRTLATEIKAKTRKEVIERDKHCIFCGMRGNQICHIIPRSRGGLGIKENLVLGCWECHMKLDQSVERKHMLQIAENIIDYYYPCFDKTKRIYKK